MTRFSIVKVVGTGTAIYVTEEVWYAGKQFGVGMADIWWRVKYQMRDLVSVGRVGNSNGTALDHAWLIVAMDDGVQRHGF